MAKHRPNAAEQKVAGILRKKGNNRAAEIVEAGKGVNGRAAQQILEAAKEAGVDTGWVR